MKFLLCIFALMAWVSADSNGRPVSIEKHPHQVSLQFRKVLLPFVSYEHLCGGSIYSDRVVITAAHCAIKDNPSHFRVAAGTNNRNGNSGSFAAVKKIIVHENYNSNSHANDIAIIVLGSPLPLNNKSMRAIQLADKDSVEGEMATTTGWGAMSGTGDVSDILREIQMPIVSNKVCNEDYSRRITNSMLCAGYRGAGGNGACQEENGSPLVVNGKLVGVLSWGMGCALPNYPGVYTKISSLRPWLLKTINSL